ncbi:MAG: hypothetical protein PHW69_00535 [Elusimicrobiaceae bacterium]|nr:hypothetical protein [Elusimicrobiaceae bacterium]
MAGDYSGLVRSIAVFITLLAVPCGWAGGFLPDGSFSKEATGTTAAAFIKDPYGAVYAALGSAGSAYRSPYSVFFNPAGLTGDKVSALRNRRQTREEKFEVDAQTVPEGVIAYNLQELRKHRKERNKKRQVESDDGVLLLEAAPAPSAQGNTVGSALGASYDSMFETYSRSALTCSMPVGAGVVAASLLYASQDALDGFSTRGDYTGSFNAYDSAAGLSYARTIKLRRGEFDAGITFKYITSRIENAEASTIAADIGILTRDFVDQGGLIRDFAVTVRNLGLPMKMDTVAEPLPLELSAGVMLDAGQGWYGYIDGKFPCDYSPYVAVGLEWKPVRRKTCDVDFALRAGFNMKRSHELGGLGGWSAGAGLGFGGLVMDYAWVPMNDLGSTNRFSLTWRWGGPASGGRSGVTAEPEVVGFM